MSVRSRRRSARSQASAAAQLQYLPQAQALSQLLRSTSDQYAADVGQTRSFAASVRANALSQVNPLKGALQGIIDQQRADNATNAGRLAAIGPGGADYAAAAAREAQAADSRLSGTQAGAVTELNSRAADASSGAQYAVNALTTKKNQDLARIGEQIAGVGQQKGLYQAKAFQDALQTLRQQDITLAGVRGANKRAAASLEETTRHHRQTEEQAAQNTAKGPKSKPKLTSSAQDKYRSFIGQVVSVVKSSPSKDDKGKPLNDHLIRQHLMNGQNPLKKVVGREDVNVAMDLARLGYLSPPNRRYLKSKGVHIPRAWIPRPGQVAAPRGASVPSLYGSAR